jgi:tetratricopeptide (TPR) repeat protein
VKPRHFSPLIIACLLSLSSGASAPPVVTPQRAPQPAANAPSSSLVVKSEPGAIIWVDNLRYGTVPQGGELTVKNLRAGSHTVRARLLGKRELIETVQLTANSERTLQLTFTLPASEAEKSFQTAEALREKGKHAEAIEEYRRAIKLRGNYPAARIGLARSLAVKDDYDSAIAEARRAAREAATQPALGAEAQTVVANTLRIQGFTDAAVRGYRAALAAARSVSPEAHTGLAIAYQDTNRPEDAIRHFRLAAAQSNDTEPVIYYLLGNLLDRENRYKEAIEVYEKYLALEPQSRHATAVRSLIKQLRREVERQ